MYTKIAKEIKKKSKKHENTLEDLALGPGLFLGGNTLGVALVTHSHRNRPKDFKLSYKDALKLYGLDPKNIDIYPAQGELGWGYIPKSLSPTKENILFADEHHPTLLHELSHAESLREGDKGLHKLRTLSYMGSKLVGLPVSLAIGASSRELFGDKDSDKWKGRALNAALLSPMLIEETKANVRALHKLHKLKKLNLKTALPLIGSELGYLSLLGAYDTGRVARNYVSQFLETEE